MNVMDVIKNALGVGEAEDGSELAALDAQLRDIDAERTTDAARLDRRRGALDDIAGELKLASRRGDEAGFSQLRMRRADLETAIECDELKLRQLEAERTAIVSRRDTLAAQIEADRAEVERQRRIAEHADLSAHLDDLAVHFVGALEKWIASDTALAHDF